MTGRQRCVLVFAGADPSGGAGIAADILAIHAQGAHALPVITALTVQDNDRVYEVQAVDAELVLRQARALMAKVSVDAVKIGIPGSAANARAIAEVLRELRAGREAAVPVVLDPVLASGHGDLLSRDDAVLALEELLPLVTLLTPNGGEAEMLARAAEAGRGSMDPRLRGNDTAVGCGQVLITGGHDGGDTVINRWFGPDRVLLDSWSWPRLPGEFHGSGCTLAAAIAGLLALGYSMQHALERAQHYTYNTLATAFAIAPGQRIPQR